MSAQIKWRLLGLLAIYGAIWLFAAILNNAKVFRNWPLDLGIPTAVIALFACVGGGVFGFAAVIGVARVVEVGPPSERQPE